MTMQMEVENGNLTGRILVTCDDGDKTFSVAPEMLVNLDSDLGHYAKLCLMNRAISEPVHLPFETVEVPQ